MEINKVKIMDLLSNILRVESDRTSHQAHIVLENRQIFKFEFDTLQFGMVTDTERTVEQIQINREYYVALFDEQVLDHQEPENQSEAGERERHQGAADPVDRHDEHPRLAELQKSAFGRRPSSNKVIQKKQMDNGVTSLISSKYHPLAIVYGHQGFIQVVQVVDGEVITTLGPFKSIDICHYDEAYDILSVIEDNKNLKMFHLSLKNIGHKKIPDPTFKPIVMHTFDNKELLPSATAEQIEQNKTELTDIVKAFMTTREVKHLITLEKNFETLKARINICDHYDFLLMMRKVNMLKYKNGMKKIGFNMVYEEFSFCQHIENKFSNIISCCSISSKKRFLVISSRGMPIYVYSLATLTKIHEIDDKLNSETVDICITPDEKLLIKASETGDILSWELQGMKPVHKIRVIGDEGIVAIGCSSDSRYISISRNDSTIEFFDLVGSRQAKRIIKVHYNKINFFMFLDNYKGLTFGVDHNIRKWDIDVGIRKGIVTGHSNKIIGLFRLNEKQIISCSIDKTLRLWDVEKNFVCINTFTIIEDEPLSFDLSDDRGCSSPQKSTPLFGYMT